jgi:hypothetical protein
VPRRKAFNAKAAKDAKERKSFNAKAAESAEENNSLNAEAAKYLFKEQNKDR